MLKIDKKALSSETLVVLVILVVLVVMLFSSGVTKEANPNEKDSAASKIFGIVKNLGLFTQQGSQGALYARGNSEKLLQLPEGVNPTLYDFPIERIDTSRTSPMCVVNDLGTRELTPPLNFHYGIDIDCEQYIYNLGTIGASRGDKIKSISNGEVVFVGSGAAPLSVIDIQPSNTYPAANGANLKDLGNQVHIYDKDNGFLIIYGHLQGTSVNVGETVTKGTTVIGFCGNTGNVKAEPPKDGSHLHLQIHAVGTEKPINDIKFDYASRQIPSMGAPVNPAILIADRLKCCSGFSESACDPRTVDQEVFKARLNR